MLKISRIILALILTISMLFCGCSENVQKAIVKSDAKNVSDSEIEGDIASVEKIETLNEDTHSGTAALATGFTKTPYKEIHERIELNYEYSGKDMIFSAKTIEGKEFESEEFFRNGNLTVLTVWSTYCTACVKTMPVWAKLAKEYEGSGVQFLGICEDVSEGDDTLIATAGEIISDTGAEYTQLINGDGIMQKVMSNVMYLPTTFFIDSDGKTICTQYIGYTYETDWINIIETIMEEKA